MFFTHKLSYNILLSIVPLTYCLENASVMNKIEGKDRLVEKGMGAGNGTLFPCGYFPMMMDSSQFSNRFSHHNAEQKRTYMRSHFENTGINLRFDSRNSSLSIKRNHPDTEDISYSPSLHLSDADIFSLLSSSSNLSPETLDINLDKLYNTLIGFEDIQLIIRHSLFFSFLILFSLSREV